VTAFLNLATALDEAGWVERVRKSSRLSGNAIAGRLFILPRETGIEAEVVGVLADE
jgi:hypothetical protein